MLEWGGSEDPATEETVSAQRADAYRALEQGTVEKGKALLQKMRGVLSQRRIDVAELLVQFDEPLDPRAIARDILKTARERDYATVVIGRHSFSGLKHWFQHHVSEELVRTGQGFTIWVVE
jgi:nucleotide-binding universal stress UspA family protein